jgi:CBS domain-containing protein
MTPHRDERWTVLWTRGQACARIAELVSGGTASRADGDLKTACIANRANVLVTQRAASFDLASTLVPLGIDDDSPDPPLVIGAVGTGPHSPLVAATTSRLAAGLGADAILITMSPDEEDDAEAHGVLVEMAAHAPGADTRAVRADNPAALLNSLPPTGLLVLGAPGGSWWQRQFFGAGRRLIHAAPAGSVIVRAAERRCFHEVEEMTAVGPLMRAADAATVATAPVIPVVDGGIVIGQVRVDALRTTNGSTRVGDLAEAPITVLADEPIDAITDLAARLGGAPVPVVDDESRLLGGVTV